MEQVKGKEKAGSQRQSKSGGKGVKEKSFFSMGVCLCVADRGELHRVAVVGQNATLLQEIPLFTSQEPVNNILLHQVAHLQINSRSETHRHKYTKCPEYLLYYSVFL